MVLGGLVQPYASSLTRYSKTQIALEYAYWVQETCANVSVFWVHASNLERFRESYTYIALECRIAGYDDPKADVLQLVKRWLERNDRGWWLMIMDNADDAQLFGQPGGLGEHIPECSHGTILVTTRNKQAGLGLAKGKTPTEVGTMDDDESEQLLRANIGGSGVASGELLALSSRLEYLPLRARPGGCIHRGEHDSGQRVPRAPRQER